MTTDVLSGLLARHEPRNDAERADLARASELAAGTADPWHRSHPVHFTASALVVHPPTRRVLLRRHERQQTWLHVGGHGDPGETDPLDIALREGREETGLTDLAPWPTAALDPRRTAPLTPRRTATLVHVAVVPVPASPREPAHEHADLRFLLATETPDAARPERPTAPLRWLSVPEAREATAEDNLRETLDRLALLFAAGAC